MTRRSPDPTRAALPGFSLVELLMVVAIIGAISAVAVPRYAQSMNRYRADAAARRIVADLDLARTTARATSSTQWITFNVAAGLYTASMASLDRAGAGYSVALRENPYGVTLLSASFAGGPTIRFDGYGVADAGGQVVVQCGDATRTVIIDASTGAVSLQ